MPVKYIFFFLLFSHSALAGVFDHAYFRDLYIHGHYPHMIFNQPFRSYFGDCFSEDEPTRRNSGDFLVQKQGVEWQGRLNVFGVPGFGFYPIEYLDGRTLQLFGAFPDRVEIRQSGFQLILRVYDGFAPDKIYCRFW